MIRFVGYRGLDAFVDSSVLPRWRWLTAIIEQDLSLLRSTINSVMHCTTFFLAQKQVCHRLCQGRFIYTRNTPINRFFLDWSCCLIWYRVSIDTGFSLILYFNDKFEFKKFKCNKCIWNNWKVLFLNASFERCECSKYSSANLKLAKVFWNFVIMFGNIHNTVKDFVTKYSTKF